MVAALKWAYVADSESRERSRAAVLDRDGELLTRFGRFAGERTLFDGHTLEEAFVRTLAKALTILASLTLGAPATTAAAPAKPNIVVIMVDNLGYGDLGAYGGMRAPTPRIDALAREGVLFRDFQVEPGCTPTRAAFMTGRMPIRSGNSGFVTPGGKTGLHPREITLAEVLKDAGYRTANFGKWHLGELPERQPHAQGFDEFYGVLNTSIPEDPSFPGFVEGTIPTQKVLRAKAGEPAEVVGQMTLRKRGLMDRELTTMAVEYIGENAVGSDPFFLLITYVNPHHPVVPHPDFVGKSEGGAYTDVLMEIDYNTGLVLDAIEEAGVRENTVVVWFSDNGPTRYSPEADHNGDPGPWSGELGSAWEGGLRTTGIMRWPGRVRAGWVCDEIFHVMDLFTTLSTIAGGDLPLDRPIDGLDQTAFLLGEQPSSARDHTIVFFYGKLTAIRWRQFKTHMVIYDRFQSLAKPAKDLGILPRLYNLRTDPKELFDLMGRSGALPMFEQFQRVAAPYLASFREFPNNDYSSMKAAE